MKVSSLFVAFVLSIVLTGCFKGEGQVRIDSDVQNAIIYIDGDKKGMTGDGYTTIILDEGDHEVRIYKEIDKEWYYEGTQNIFVGANSSVKVKIDMDKKPTEFRLERLAKEKKAEEERLLREKKEREERLAKEKKEREERLAREKKAEEERLAREKQEMEERFMRDKERTFRDYKQKLVWQDNPEVESIIKPWITSANFYDAKNYNDTSGDTATTYCKNLSLAGHNDWRLPTVTELESLYASKKDLKYVRSTGYWSSNTSLNTIYYALVVYFNNGHSGRDGKNDSNYVRCVRAGQ